jgi:hypothetical protein
MSSSNAKDSKDDPFMPIGTEDLQTVSGGATRVAASSSTSDANSQLMLMLTQIGDSIKDLARNNNGGGMDSTTMMMMMMMMGGFGGGGGGYGAPIGQPPTYVSVDAGLGGGGWGGCGGKCGG